MNQQSYEELRAADIARDAELRHQSNRYTALRTTSFLGLIFAFAAGYDGHPVANLLGIGLLLLFIIIVIFNAISRMILLRIKRQSV